jgi:carbamate kinase
MTVPEETRIRLTQWCSARVPGAEREQRQVGYSIQGDEITVVERRPPAYPELGPAWSTTPVARLRRNDEGWTLLQPLGDGGWRRAAGGPDPIDLLDQAAARR